MVLLLSAMTKANLERKISLLQATAINMTDMVGIGPFIVLSSVAGIMNGPWFLYAWVAGAALSFIDAMVWSELGSTFPLAGGSFNFLKEGYGPKWGKLMSFLFVWQTMIQAPLVIASAAIGFSQYLSFIVHMNTVESKMVSGAVVMLIVILLYRKIEAIGKISLFLWLGVLLTMSCIIFGGIFHGNFTEPITHINDGLSPSLVFAGLLMAASSKTMYSYLGYYNVCHLGGEIVNPQRNISRSMFISVAGIAAFYLLMNISVASVLPFSTITDSRFVISDYISALAGNTAANIITALILWVAFASVFSATLGYSRIPYAAAKDGAFFSIFAKLHPTKHFPYVSLLILGAVAFIFSVFFDRVSDVISAILAVRILVQFVGQGIGLILLSRRKGRDFIKWKMPLFPLPVIIGGITWLFIFYSTGPQMMLSGIIVIVLGVIVYMIKSILGKDWPFENKQK